MIFLVFFSSFLLVECFIYWRVKVVVVKAIQFVMIKIKKTKKEERGWS